MKSPDRASPPASTMSLCILALATLTACGGGTETDLTEYDASREKAVFTSSSDGTESNREAETTVSSLTLTPVAETAPTTGTAEALKKKPEPIPELALPASFVWTPVRRSADTRVVYLSSSSGNDANDCLAETRACKTPARAIAQMRNGFPDHLLIKRGDTFIGSLATAWALSGRSALEPTVIAAYGSSGDRPYFRTGNALGFATTIKAPVRHLHIMDLRFHANERDPADRSFNTSYTKGVPTGISIRGYDSPLDNILIEGCEVSHYGNNLTLTGASNLRVRANYIHHAWKINGEPMHQGHSSGLFANHVNGLLLEQNVVQHNGGLYTYPNDPQKTIPPGLSLTNVSGTWFNHQLYSDSENRSVRLIGNVFANGNGVSLRSGGEVINNIFVRLISSLSGGDDDNLQRTGGFDFHVQDNVFMDGTDFPAESTTPGARGWGVTLTNTSPAGSLIARNTFIRDMTAGQGSHAITLQGAGLRNGIPMHIRAATISENLIYNWRGGIKLRGTPGTELNNVLVQSNLVQNPADASGTLTQMDGVASTTDVNWTKNVYFSSRTDGKAYRLGSPMSFVDWSRGSGEADSFVQNRPAANGSVKFEEAVLGAGAAYSMAFQRLGQQTRWSWDGRLETRALILNIRSTLLGTTQ